MRSELSWGFPGLSPCCHSQEGWKRRKPPAVVSDSSNVPLKALPRLAQEDSSSICRGARPGNPSR